MNLSSPIVGSTKLHPGLTKGERVGQTLWFSIFEGGFTMVFAVWTSGSILTGLLIHLGASPLQLAASASLPFLVQAANPVWAWLVDGIGSRKTFMMLVASLGRVIWLVPVILPLMGFSAAVLPAIMIGVIFVSSLFQSAAGPAWASMMSDVVPDADRGRYFGLRNGLLGLVGMVSGLGAGWYLDRHPGDAGFQMVMLVAVVFALVGIRLLSLHHDPEMKRSGAPLFKALAEPLKDLNFRRFLFFSVYWNAAVMLAAPFVIPYFFSHLKMTFTQVAIWSAIASIATMVIGTGWGRIADRVGHKQVLKITTFLAGTVHPACWMLATPGHLAFIWLSGLMDALSWGGINTAMFNLGIVTAPRDRRMMYLAVAGAVSGLAGFSAGLFSGVLLDVLLVHDAWLGSFHWTGYHSLFAISAVLRMQAFWLLAPVHEVQSVSTRIVLKWLWNRTLNILPWRVA